MTHQLISKWRTTKIPAHYFEKVESYIEQSQTYISVSDFIRSAIQEKLSQEKSNFLLFKDIVFNESEIIHIHDIITSKFESDSKKLMNHTLLRIVEKSLDLDMFTFLAKFFKHFAKYHPFEDGNKRTALVTADVFLRINNLKLTLEANVKKETTDELFFWQNSNQQKTLNEIVDFLQDHVIHHKTDQDVEQETKNSIKENELMLKKLSR